MKEKTEELCHRYGITASLENSDLVFSSKALGMLRISRLVDDAFLHKALETWIQNTIRQNFQNQFGSTF